jgi:CDP-diacylglycerol--glycerol-3-phosphate 3-phosphatidyltransferase
MWNASNLLSLSRVFLAIPMAFLLWYEYNILAVAMGFVASITDMLDGWLARKLDQVTEYGKIFDPVADKIFVGVTVVVLLLQGRFPLWLVVIVLARDLLIALGGIFAAKKLKSVIPSDVIGKATVIILGFTIMFAILNLHDIAQYGYYLSAFALLFSFLHYTNRAVRIIMKKE